jgi:hypothetical protein
MWLFSLLLAWLFHDNSTHDYLYKRAKWVWLRRVMLAVSGLCIFSALAIQPAAAGITIAVCIVLPIFFMTAGNI